MIKRRTAKIPGSGRSRVIGALGLAATALSGHPASAQHLAPPPAPEPAIAAAAVSPASVPSGAGEQLLHARVGHVLLLNATNRVRRIYIANPSVLDSYTASPRQIVLTAKAAGSSSVVVWDEIGTAQTYLVRADSDTDDLSKSLRDALPNEDIHAEERDGRVLLTGTVGTAAISESAAKLAGQFSKEVVNSLVVNSARLKQVRLQVRIIEVDRSRLNQFGINIFNPGGATTVGAGGTNQFPTTATFSSSGGGAGNSVGGGSLTVSNALNFLFYSAKANVGVTVEDLENKQVLQILAEPTISAISGHKASFLAGGEFPFPVVQGGAGGLTSITIQFRPYGVKLDFTPEVNVDGSIALKVVPEVSALDYTNAVQIDGYTIPALSTRHAETQVVLRSGQSFAISGLLDKRTTDSLGRTPGIASVPVLGALFRSKSVNLSTSELIVLVTPTLINPLTDTAAPETPAPVRPFMNPQAFDKALPASTVSH